jgi:hypothetical protein
MFSTKRSRARAVIVAGMTVVAGLTAAVTYQASAAEVSPAADSRAVPVPAIPDAIKPPAGSKLVGAYLVVSGTQNYTCVDGGYTGASTPEAQLIGTGGRVHHFAGPSWQSQRDGSLVTAVKVASLPRSGTIPELLLQVNSRSGKGVLSKADYINRLLTSGGVAPTGTCAAGESVKVPYKAVYVFWDDPAV